MLRTPRPHTARTPQNAPRRLGLAAGATAAAVLAVTVASPAQAAVRRFEDPQDPGHSVDLRAVAVRNAPHRVAVTLRYADLRRDPASAAGGAVYLDTDRRRHGPEFVVVGGYYEGTDYQLLRTRGFGSRAWGAPVEGSYRMSVDYARDTVRIEVARRALDGPGALRVAVRASGPHDVDWLGAARSFTPWVPRA